MESELDRITNQNIKADGPEDMDSPPHSSVTISETFKLLLSSVFFYREWRQRGYMPELGEALSEIKFEDVEEGKERDGQKRKQVSDTLSLNDENYASHIEETETSFGHRPFHLKAFLGSCKDEIPVEIRYGFVHLALFYVLINNTVC